MYFSKFLKLGLRVLLTQATIFLFFFKAFLLWKNFKRHCLYEGNVPSSGMPTSKVSKWCLFPVFLFFLSRKTREAFLRVSSVPTNGFLCFFTSVCGRVGGVSTCHQRLYCVSFCPCWFWRRVHVSNCWHFYLRLVRVVLGLAPPVNGVSST